MSERSFLKATTLLSLALSGAGAAAPLPPTQGREVFRAHVFEGTKVTEPVGTVPFQKSDYIRGSLSMDFSPAQTLAWRDRPGATTVHLATPIQSRVSGQVTFKFTGKPDETFTGTVELQTGHGTVCKTSVPISGSSGSSATVSLPQVSCGNSDVYIFWLTWASLFGTQVKVTATGSKGTANSADVLVYSLYEYLENEISVSGVSPSNRYPLPAGKQTFIADVTVSLQSRPAGDLVLRAYDQRDALLGSSAPLRVLVDDLATGTTWHMQTTEVPISNRVTQVKLRAEVLEPAQTALILQSADTLYSSKARCSLEGVVKREAMGRYDKETYWLPDVLVDLADEFGVSYVKPVKAKPEPNDPSIPSWYCFQFEAGFDLEMPYRLRVRLQDDEDLGKARLAVFPWIPASGAGVPAALLWEEQVIPSETVRRDLLVDKDLLEMGVKAYELTWGEHAESAVEAWWHLWRSVNRMSDSLPAGFDPVPNGFNPIRVYRNPVGRTWPCPKARSCYIPSGTFEARSSIFLSEGASQPGAKPFSLWHEFGHHLIRQLYADSNGPARPDGKPESEQNHGGYTNQWTTDSVDEGFATFWALRSRQVLDGKPGAWYFWNEPSPTMGFGLSLEGNFRAWDFRRADASASVPEKAVEDLAFAGLLWDLIDTDQDAEAAADVTWTKDGPSYSPSDTVTWDARSLTTFLKDTKPGTILAFHDELAKLPLAFNSPASRAGGLSELDELFVMHRMFHDNAPANWSFDLGERVGKNANGAVYYGPLGPEPIDPRPTREEPPIIPGSFVDVSFLTPSGKPATDGKLRLEQRFGAAFSHLDTAQELPIAAGKVYLPMPPPQYPVTVTVSVPGRDESPVVFDSTYYTNHLGTGETFLKSTFTVDPPAPVVSTLVPGHGAPGSSVLIAGRDFASPVGLNRVTFGGAPASVASLTEEGLTVTVPPSLGEGLVPVVVTTADGASLPVDYLVETPILSVTPGSYEFGNVYTGGAREAEFTLRNVGTSKLRISASVSSDPAFSVSDPRLPSTIRAGGQTVMKVSFSPQQEGPVGGTLYLATNDPVTRLREIKVSGNGGTPFGPAVKADPAILDFGTVAVGQSRKVDVYAESVGSADLTVSAVTSSHPAVTVTATPALPATLHSGSVWLQTTFTPTAAGLFSGTLTIASSDPRQPVATVSWKGTGGTSTSPCTCGVSPAVLSLPALDGSGEIEVTAPSGCAWTASAGGFASVSPPSGDGPATVTVRAPGNPGPGARTTTVSIGGLPVRVEQASPGATQGAFVPIVLSTAGAAGSFYTSELTLTNRGTTDAVVELTYTPAMSTGSGTGVDILPAGRQVIFRDALAYLRSLGIPIPSTGNRGGTISVRFRGLSSPSAGSATVRTTTAVPEGRAGLSYAAVPAGLKEPVMICGLRQNDTDRSNVAVMNTGGEESGGVLLRLTIVSGDPTSPQSKPVEISLPPGGFAQISQVLASNGLSLSNGYVKVEPIGGNAPFYAYGVVNDQANSDGSFVPPVVVSSLAGRQGMTLPVAVETATFGTEVVVTNFGTSARTARLTYAASAITGGSTSIDLALAPGEQRVIPSFVAELRSRGLVGPAGPTFVGPVFLSAPGGDVSGLAIGGRTSAPGGGGRYGLFYTGLPYGRAAESSAWLYGLQQDGENRSNLALVNTGEVDGSPSAFDIELYDGATGGLVKTIAGTALSARSFTQLSSILKTHAPGVTSGYARVVKTAGANPFLCYAVINDGGEPGERSDDGAFVVMEAGDGAEAQPAITVNPAAVDFGSVAVGQSAERTIALASSGTGPLTVTSLTASGAGFSVAAPATPFTMAAGASVDASVRFAPAAAGPASGALTIASDDPSHLSLTVPFTGTGTVPVPDVTAELMTDDGSVETGVVQGNLLIVNRLTPPRYPATLLSIRIFFAQYQGKPSASGSTVRVVAFADAAGSGHPATNPPLRTDVAATIPALGESGGWLDVNLDDPVTISSGDLYVGFRAPDPPGGVGFAADTSPPHLQRAFYSTDGGVTYQGPLSLTGTDGQPMPANIMIRAVVVVPGS